MEQSWSESVTTAPWRHAAEQWIDEALTQRGVQVIGPITQPRTRPWSTQLLVPTSSGRVWFKANCPAMAFEPALQRALHQLLPGDVDAPLAIDSARGWMLSPDRGPSLGEQHEPTLADWQQVLSQTARVQRALAGEKETLLAAGLPDFSPGTVAERFAWFIERFARLPADHPSHVSAPLAGQLERASGHLVEAAEQVAQSPIPSTFGHGDVHPWNVSSDASGRLRAFDFGDAQWAFALEALSVPYGWIAKLTTMPWDAVRAAYFEHWSDVVSSREFDALWQASTLLHAVNRTATWWAALQGASRAEWAEWGSAPLAQLRNVLEGP